MIFGRHVQPIVFAGVLMVAALPGCSERSDAPKSASGAETLRSEMAALSREADRLAARGAIENAFARYQYLHTAFRDDEIVRDLWVKEGTPGISAQYTNTGVYSTWESVTAYHRNRPNPKGKLLTHFVSTPLIEVAGDGETAKAVFTVSGVESGLSDPKLAANAPDSFFEEETVNGKKVWAHWVQARYHIDFMKQDGEWRIWHFRCVEISRAPFGRNWVAFAATLEGNQAAAQFHNDILYFGDDGEVVFYPPHDGPPKNIAHGYRTEHPTAVEPPLPTPYRTFSETFEY